MWSSTEGGRRRLMWSSTEGGRRRLMWSSTEGGRRRLMWSSTEGGRRRLMWSSTEGGRRRLMWSSTEGGRRRLMWSSTEGGRRRRSASERVETPAAINGRNPGVRSQPDGGCPQPVDNGLRRPGEHVDDLGDEPRHRARRTRTSSRLNQPHTPLPASPFRAAPVAGAPSPRSSRRPHEGDDPKVPSSLLVWSSTEGGRRRLMWSSTEGGRRRRSASERVETPAATNGRNPAVRSQPAGGCPQPVDNGLRRPGEHVDDLGEEPRHRARRTRTSSRLSQPHTPLPASPFRAAPVAGAPSPRSSRRPKHVDDHTMGAGVDDPRNATTTTDVRPAAYP